MKFIPSPFRRRALALAIGAIVAAASNVTLAQEEEIAAVEEAAQGDVEYFIQLDTPSVAEINAASYNSTRQLASRAAQQRQAALVDAQQAAFRAQLASFGATELSAQRVGANGFRVSVDAGQLEALRALPGVRTVGRVERHTPDNITSVPWIGSTNVHTNLGVRGEGITIGVIDTGIDYTHANFGGPGTPGTPSPDYVAAAGTNAADVRSTTLDGLFPTAKVVGGFDFAGRTYNANIAGSVAVPDPDPVDRNGHGSHVAGSAAGIGVAATNLGAGVAPAATLYALKVFGDGGGSTNLTSLAIEWALDPNGDGDMSDHLDVINMSLGSPFGEPNDPSAISAHNASLSGIIVVTSAGNEGNVPYITGSPGAAHGAISTAANVPGGRNFATLNITAPASVAGFKFNEEGSSPRRVSAVAPLSATVVEGAPLDGCTPFTNAAAIAGRMVLVQRGGVPTGTPAGCAFAVKAQNALNAGASAMIAFNNVAGDPIVMGAITALIPGVMVSNPNGLALVAEATTDAASPVTATLGFGPDPSKADRIAVFSSRGPGEGGSNFKPDLAAPGVAIVSTGRSLGTGTAPNQGTSMASPHVAGAAALMRQLHPNLQPYTIKAMLQNGTTDANASGDNSIARNGVGSIRIDRSASLSSFALPGGVSFGHINPTALTTRTETLYVENLRKGSRTFNVTHVPQFTLPGVTVTCPSPVSLGSYGFKNTSIKLRFDPAASAAAGVSDNATISQREVSGWCVLNDGTDSLRVAYLAVVDPASGLVANPGSSSFGVSVKNNGPAAGWAEGFTLVGIGSTGSEGSYGSIAKVGVRLGDPAVYGGDVVEFGIAVDSRVEHLSNLDVDIFLDTNGDGVEDVRLSGRDDTTHRTNGIIGNYATTQWLIPNNFPTIPSNRGFIDWLPITSWDYNDRVIILPYSLTTYPAPFQGLVPASFTYRMVFNDRQGNTSTQTGSVNMANELVPDLNSFSLAKGESAKISVCGPASGDMLWLFPTNNEWYQDALVTHVASQCPEGDEGGDE